MSKCLNCGYERQEKDDQYGIIPLTECPKCHAIYEKVERLLLKKEYEKAEEWLAENKRGPNQDGNLSDPQSSSSIMKNCPYCGEEIKSNALKCRYCGEWLNQQTANKTVSPVKNKPTDSLTFSDKILSMPLGLKVLSGFLLFAFVIGLLSVIDPVIKDNNRGVSQQQGVEQQATQTQARIEAQEEQSRDLLGRCRSSCRSSSVTIDFAQMDKEADERRRCENKCEQDAMTRNIEISKLREMQK